MLQPKKGLLVTEAASARLSQAASGWLLRTPDAMSSTQYDRLKEATPCSKYVIILEMYRICNQ